MEAFGTGEKGKRSENEKVDEVREKEKERDGFGMNERASERLDIRLCG